MPADETADRPAQSRKDAQQVLDDFNGLAVEAGLAREISAVSALLPKIASKMGVPDLAPYVEAVEMQVDEVLTRWMRALREQAGVTAQSWSGDHDADQSRPRGKGRRCTHRRNR
jgi:hypothetical protein